MTETDLRLAEAADAHTCAAIVNDWIDRTPWHPRIHSHDSVQMHYANTVWPTCDVTVIGRPAVGFVAIDKDAFVTALYAQKSRHGHGSRLIRHAKSRRDQLRLWTHVPNRPAQSFYIKHGFVEVARTDGDNEEGVPDIQFLWSQS